MNNLEQRAGVARAENPEPVSTGRSDAGPLPRNPAVKSQGMMNTAPYSDQWVDCTSSAVIDIKANGSVDDDGYWPTMVQLDFYDAGCSIIASDARRLGEMLIQAADSADAIDERRFATEGSSDA